MTAAAFLGEWWLPGRREGRARGVLLSGDPFVLKLHNALVEATEEAPVFVPAIQGVCDPLGRVLLLDCWLEDRPWKSAFAEFSSVGVRVGKVLVGLHPSEEAVPTFSSAVFRASGLLGWLRQQAPRLDADVGEDGSVVGWKFGQAVTIPLLEDGRFRVAAQLGLEALDDVEDHDRDAFRLAARLLVDSCGESARLDAIWAAASRLTRLAGLLQYRDVDLRIDELTAKGARTAESYHLRPLLRETFDKQARSGVDDRPAVPFQLLTEVWPSVSAKWLAALERNGLPYHRLARSLTLSGKHVFEDRFLNIATAVAAWVEHGGGSGQRDLSKQFAEVLDTGRALLGATWPDESAELAKGARHYYVHGNLKERPIDTYADPAVLFAWTRWLTAALWAAVLNELGIPKELIQDAPSRSSTLRYDAHEAGLRRTGNPRSVQ